MTIKATVAHAPAQPKLPALYCSTVNSEVIFLVAEDRQRLVASAAAPRMMPPTAQRLVAVMVAGPQIGLVVCDFQIDDAVAPFDGSVELAP